MPLVRPKLRPSTNVSTFGVAHCGASGVGAVAVDVDRGQQLLRSPVGRGNERLEVLREVVGAEDLGVAGRTVEFLALLALTDEGFAVGLEHRDLAVRRLVRHTDDGLADEGLDLFAGEEGAARGVAGVDDADDDALAGTVLAAELGVPGAVFAAELQEIGAGVIRGVFRVRGNHQDAGILGELEGLVRGERGAEAVDRGGVLALDLDALLPGDLGLLLLQVGPVLLDLRLPGVEFLAGRRLGGRKTCRAAFVARCRLFSQLDDVAPVRVAAGIQILLCHLRNGGSRRRGGGRDRDC